MVDSVSGNIVVIIIISLAYTLHMILILSIFPTTNNVKMSKYNPLILQKLVL